MKKLRMSEPDYEASFEKYVHKYVGEHTKLYDTRQLVDSLLRLVENQQSHLNAYFSQMPPQDKSFANERELLKRQAYNVLKRAKEME